MNNHAGLVSVIIPSYNAEATLDETLNSVRNQTYRDLEIIVVDDGSDDGTVDVACRHAANDDRIRIVSIENSGVAHARNVGIAVSRGNFIAPIDADDLWHPEKIDRQMAVMRAHGPDVGFVYTLYRRIDADGRVLHSSGMRGFTGRVYLRSLMINFVGNGSSLLARRAAVEEVGGYEPDLHRQGAQGCEDYLIQILMARSWTVALVPEYLTGYRKTPGAMSSNSDRMMRSHLAMLDHVARRLPETPRAILAAAKASIHARHAIHVLRHRRLSEAAREFCLAMRLSPLRGLDVARRDLARHAIGIFKRRVLKRPAAVVTGDLHFFQCDPASGPERFSEQPLKRRLEELAKHEEAFFQKNRLLPPPSGEAVTDASATATSAASCSG